MVGLSGGRSLEPEKLSKVAVTRRIWRTKDYSNTGGGSWLIATHEVITDIPVLVTTQTGDSARVRKLQKYGRKILKI